MIPLTGQAGDSHDAVRVARPCCSCRASAACRSTKVDGNALTRLDVDLVADELASSTRGKIQTVLRSVLRSAVRAGMLNAMPVLPPLPKVGRKVPRPMRRDDLEAILSVTNAEGRLAFELAAFTRLRASELRGLRWSDVDLKISNGTSAASAGRISVGRPLRPPSVADVCPEDRRPWCNPHQYCGQSAAQTATTHFARNARIKSSGASRSRGISSSYDSLS